MIRTIIVVTLLLAGSVVAQDEETKNDEATEPAVESTDTAQEDSLDDDFENDVLSDNQDHTAEDEDVFVPSDEVSYQQSVPFPTDI